MSLRRAAERGFTLIEMLVALALMSLISVVLIESLQVGGHTWQHVTRVAARVDEISRAQQFLRQRLQTISPPRPAAVATASSESFVGESDALEFSSVAPSYSDEGWVHYRLELSGSEPADVEIRYRHRPKLPGSSEVDEGSREPLLVDAAGLSIGYLDDSEGSPGEWVSRWPAHKKLPRLIRIEVRFADTDPRRWPPLYVEPRIDTHADCVFDVVSRRCRDGV